MKYRPQHTFTKDELTYDNYTYAKERYRWWKQSFDMWKSTHSELEDAEALGEMIISRGRMKYYSDFMYAFKNKNINA